MNNEKQKWVMEILERLQMEYPEAGTMLNFSSLFELLVAVVLSAQSTDAQVNKVTSSLFSSYSTPEDFALINVDDLEQLIHGVGLYRSKARSIKQLSQIIIDEFHSQVPSDFNSLIKLPGVGRKTANVMMSVGFNQPGLGVDTHVQRVANRLGIVKEKQPEKTELALKKIIPRNYWSDSHHWFIYHGRKVCTARKPACSECVIESLCRKVF